jgi:hypothetical protein
MYVSKSKQVSNGKKKILALHNPKRDISQPHFTSKGRQKLIHLCLGFIFPTSSPIRTLRTLPNAGYLRNELLDATYQ